MPVLGLILLRHALNRFEKAREEIDRRLPAQLNDIDVSLPTTEVMKDYEIFAGSIFKLKAILNEQRTKLREARDILLPRLMSGEMEV